MLKRKETVDAYARNYMLGVTDALPAFGVIVAETGIAKREDIAATMGRALEHLVQREGAGANVRGVPLALLRDFFSAPVARDWQRP